MGFGHGSIEADTGLPIYVFGERVLPRCGLMRHGPPSGVTGKADTRISSVRNWPLLLFRLSSMGCCAGIGARHE